MQKTMKKIIAGIMMIILAGFLPVFHSYADSTCTITLLDVQYNQTDARTMLDMVNDLRTGEDAWYWNSSDTEKVVCSGLNELVYNYDLEAAAMQRAAEIAVSWGHTRPDGTSCFTVCDISNGENIAVGYSSPQTAFEAFCETDESYSGQGHRRNMLGSSYKSVGFGYAEVNGISCWVQEFGTTVTSTYVEACDTTKNVDIEILESSISEVSVTPSRTIVSAVAGDSTELPELTVKIKTTNEWSYFGWLNILSDYDWTIEDTSVAVIENGVIKGNKAGSTTLSATILGTECRITVNILEYAETEHTYDSGVVTAEPTCTTKGVMTYTCTGCGDTYIEEIDALGHDWPDECNVIVTEPTCTEAGSGKRCCTRGCGWYMPVDIPATGHTVVADKGYAASCTEDGLTDGSHCSVCGEVIEAQEIIPAGHTVVADKGYAASCTEDGLTAGSHCSVCGEVIEAQEVIPATGHTVVADKGYAASCTEDGLTDGSHCSVCGEVIEAQEVIPATGHTVVADKGYAASCTEDGLTDGSHCSVCGEVIEAQEVIPATGHDWTVSEKVNATYSSTGYIKYVCNNCGELKTTNIARLTLSVPSLKRTVNTTAGMYVEWSKVTGASGYYVYRKTVGGSWSRIATVSNASTVAYTDKNAVSGTTYYYTVRAYCGSNIGGYVSDGIKGCCLKTPTVSSLVNTSTGVRVNWNTVRGASGYYIFQRTATGSWKWIGTANGQSKSYYIDTKAVPGTSYAYTVRAYNSTTNSSYTGGKAIKYLKMPTLKATASTGGITVKWAKTTGATGYYLYRKTAGGSWTRIATIKNGSTITYTDKKVVKGTRYYYTVRAYYGSYYSAFHTTGAYATAK